MLNHLSALTGFLAHIELPRPLAQLLVRAFARSYSIRIDECESPIESYRSIGQFFTRALKPEARPIGDGLVSPVDGTLRSFGVIENGKLPQVKGKDYSVSSFLRDSTEAVRFEGGTFFNLYLSPQDYHCVHTPLAGTVVRSVHIPGKLFPVNDFALHHVADLFSVNERLVTYIRTDRFTFALVMVGATNVGKISVTYDSFFTNRVWSRKADKNGSVTRKYDKPIQLKKGDKLGTFHLGSSVVLLFPPLGSPLSPFVEPCQKVQLGQTLVSLPGTPG